MQKISYDGYRFPAEIIRQAIWLYMRFTLPRHAPTRSIDDTLAKIGREGFRHVSGLLRPPTRGIRNRPIRESSNRF